MFRYTFEKQTDLIKSIRRKVARSTKILNARNMQMPSEIYIACPFAMGLLCSIQLFFSQPSMDSPELQSHIIIIMKTPPGSIY